MINVYFTGNPGRECIITTKAYRRRWWLFGKRIPVVREYRGSCTFWRDHNTGGRLSHSVESWLGVLWVRAQSRLGRNVDEAIVLLEDDLDTVINLHGMFETPEIVKESP